MKQVCIVLMCAIGSMAYGERNIENSKMYQREGSSLSILSGTMDLPSDGLWEVDVVSMDTSSVQSLYLDVEERAFQQLEGRRMGEILLKQKIKAARYPLSSISWDIRRYAKTNSNNGPATVFDLGTAEENSDVKRFLECPWSDVPIDKEAGPYFYLVPNVEFEFKDEEKWSWPTNRAVIAFELRPYLDDGKHWISYTDGTCQREEIDEELLAENNQVIRPIFQSQELDDADAPASYAYTFLAVVPDNERQTVSIPLTNSYVGGAMTARWNLADTQPGDASLADLCREYQLGEWFAYWDYSKSSVLGAWIATTDAKQDLVSPRTESGETTSAFGVMGGYAALRETLQMQLIAGGEGSEEQTVPIESIDGVQVASHAYEKMLGDEDGGHLALAELVPPDRFFAYVAKPETMLPLLNEGADFISQMGSTHTGNSIKYYLKKRYLKRLGMDEKWLTLILRSGGVSECAVMAPDMFFLDGTEVTVISRLTQPAVIMSLLEMIGISELSSRSIVEMKNAAGQMVYWALAGDLLITGTSKTELEHVLELREKEGDGSLGKSAEFRYMLTQLPVNEQTRAYAYCSDPFIRRLVGPATKIGQLRRINVIARMKQISAAALLARLDGIDESHSLQMLREYGYLPETFNTDGYTLDENLVVHSDVYGTLDGMNSLSAIPINLVSPKEAAAYKTYVDNYTRFWRQFFDPIAFRLDDTTDGALEATVFILPLIDSSIYSGIKEFIVSQENGVPLRIPKLHPDPVLQFSVNLNEKAWMNVSEGLSEMLQHYVFIDPAILDDLGSSVHLMVHDADPVIALGSGDLLGGFGGHSVLGDDEMIIPIALSVLTRPCTIAVETGNPEKTATYLRNAVDSYVAAQGWEELSSELYQVGDGDSWVCLFDIMGMVKMRFGLEVKDDFLLIRNIPWSNKDEVKSVENAMLTAAALTVYPAAGRLQLPGLHSTASEKSRTATMQGLGLLFPLVQSGDLSVKDAAELHMKLFGYTPYQPSNDLWSWKEMSMESERYGSVYKKKQPAYMEGDTAFGLMQAIQAMELQMQFEDTGLRTRLKWKLRKD